MTDPQNPAVVDGVDVDAVAAAVRSAPAVDDLSAGGVAGLGTYLPGRVVPGIRVEQTQVTVQVRSRWGVSTAQIAAEIRSRIGSLVGGRRIDIVVADITNPPSPGPFAPGAST